MTPDPPRSTEPAPEHDEPHATGPKGRSSSVVGGLVLIAAAVAGVVAVSLSAPHAGTTARTAADTSRRAAAPALPNVVTQASDLVEPSYRPREKGPSPVDQATTDSAVAGCTAMIREAVGEGVEVGVGEVYGDIDSTKGRPDSLIIEGRAGSRAFHCAGLKRGDGAIARIDTLTEESWGPGALGEFPGAHAVTVAAEESCLAQFRKLFPEFVIRGVALEHRGAVLHLSGDAFPLDNDLIRHFSCDATVRDGRVVDAKGKRDS